MRVINLSLIGAAAGNYSIAEQKIQKNFTITLPNGSEVSNGEAPVLEETDRPANNLAAFLGNAGTQSSSSESSSSSSTVPESSSSSSTASVSSSSESVSGHVQCNR